MKKLFQRKQKATGKICQFNGGGVKLFRQFKGIAMCAILLSAVLCGCSSKDKAYLPFGYQDYPSMIYEDAKRQLQDAGFTNINSNTIPITDKEKDGKLKEIKIDGDMVFREGSAKKKDTPIDLNYYVLKQYEVTMNVRAGGEQGEPEFTIDTNLPYSTKLILTLTGDDYAEQQTVTVGDEGAASEAFTDSGKPLASGEYTLTVVMKMEDQGATPKAELGKNGECLTGELVEVDSTTGTPYVFFECEYESTYKEPETEAYEPEVSVDAIISVIDMVLSESYGENYELNVDGQIITANVWNEGVAIGATLAVQGNTELIDDWNTMVEAVKYNATTIQEVLSSSGYDDMQFIMNVQNDINKDNTLLTVWQGSVWYDAVNGIDMGALY